MKSEEHVNVARLIESAVAGLRLREEETEHLETCDGCQDICQIFAKEFVGQTVSHWATSSVHR